MQTKTKLYYATDVNCRAIGGYVSQFLHHVYSLFIIHWVFTKQEKELYKALCNVSAKTLWGAAIKDCLQRFDRSGNRELFTELSMSLGSQLKDCPQVMKNILGEKAYTVLSHIASS
jgi:hypothetical protein